VACFSYDDNHELRMDDSSLRYYYDPELPSCLSDGFETFIKHDDTIDEHIDSLLEAIIDLEKKKAARCTPDIVTWRGLMTKVRLEL
jgi:RAT1-interacting protein